jgi:hypothetical protein
MSDHRTRLTRAIADYIHERGPSKLPKQVAILSMLASGEANELDEQNNRNRTGSPCPICGSEIQGTWVTYRNSVELSPDCRAVVHDGHDSMGDGPELDTIYCERDHSQSQMIEWLGEGRKPHTGDSK